MAKERLEKMSKKESNRMLIPTLIMGVLALILLGYGYAEGKSQHVEGLKLAAKMIIEILPLLLFAFIVAGMIRILLPHEVISRWVGAESGFKGLMIGTVAGGFMPGGPYVSLPVAAGLLRAGAGVGTMVAFLTAWSLWAVSRIPMEIGIMGWKFVLIRIASTFFFPPLAGWLAQILFPNFKY